MKKLKKYGLSINFLILAGISLFLSSCGREMGSVSFNNEKLRKQSLEIENSKNSSSTSNIVTTTTTSEEVVTASNSEEPVILSPSKTNSAKEITKAPEVKGQKLNFVQKLALKKLAKKLGPNENLESKRGGMDQNLRYAVIFGGVGIILIILGSLAWVLYVLGVVSLVIGLIFLLLWALSQ